MPPIQRQKDKQATRKVMFQREERRKQERMSDAEYFRLMMIKPGRGVLR